MTQLYSDLVDGSGRRYYFSLTRATGGLSPAAPAALTAVGLAPTIFQNVVAFRTPDPATVSVIGYAPPSLTPVMPGVATITIGGLAPSNQTIRIVSPALPAPDYSTPNELIPTIAFIQTVTPDTAQLSIQALTLNAFPGGDIVYVTPGVGSISIQSLSLAIINNQPGVASIAVSGLTPTLQKEMVVQPDTANIIINGQSVSAERGFVWIDADAPPPLTWTTTTGVTA